MFKRFFDWWRNRRAWKLFLKFKKAKAKEGFIVIIYPEKSAHSQTVSLSCPKYNIWHSGINVKGKNMVEVLIFVAEIIERWEKYALEDHPSRG